MRKKLGFFENSGIGVFIFFTAFCLSCSQASIECPSIVNGIKYEPFVGTSLSDKQLSLGFDVDSIEVSEEISDVLNQFNIKSVFYMDGTLIGSKGSYSILRSLINSGHRLANIGYSRREVEKNRNIEIQFRSVDYILTRVQNDSIFFIRFHDEDVSRAKVLNRYGLGKYIGPLGNAGQALPKIAQNNCQISGQDQICQQEIVSYIQAVRKGLILIPKLVGIGNVSFFLRNILTNLQQLGFEFVPLTDIPEISREVALRVGPTGNRSCDDYSRN